MHGTTPKKKKILLNMQPQFTDKSEAKSHLKKIKVKRSLVCVTYVMLQVLLQVEQSLEPQAEAEAKSIQSKSKKTKKALAQLG